MTPEARLRIAIRGAIDCIKRQPITVIADTIWYSETETLCDMLESALDD